MNIYLFIYNECKKLRNLMTFQQAEIAETMNDIIKGVYT